MDYSNQCRPQNPFAKPVQKNILLPFPFPIGSSFGHYRWLLYNAMPYIASSPKLYRQNEYFITYESLTLLSVPSVIRKKILSICYSSALVKFDVACYYIWIFVADGILRRRYTSLLFSSFHRDLMCVQEIRHCSNGRTRYIGQYLASSSQIDISFYSFSLVWCCSTNKRHNNTISCWKWSA